MTTEEQKAVEIVKKTIEIARTTNATEKCIVGMMMPFIDSLSNLRKPSERPSLKEFYEAHECLEELEKDLKSTTRLSAYIQMLENYIDGLESKLSEKPAIMEILTDHDEIKAEMDRMLGFGEPEQGEPETKVGEAGEELVKLIEVVLHKYSAHGIFTFKKRRNYIEEKTGREMVETSTVKIEDVATEIAQLLQPDANAELLSECGEWIETRLNSMGCQTESTPLKSDAEDFGGLQLLRDIRMAISNYEKQQ